ncbi:MAG: carbon-nitrogen hydrolase family protein [Parvularculaceae bacterium]
MTQINSNSWHPPLARFTAVIGQISLTSPTHVLEQIALAIDNNQSSDLFVFPEYATCADSLKFSDLPYLNDDPALLQAAQNWARCSAPCSEVFRLSEKFGKAVVFGCLDQVGAALKSRCYFHDPITKTTLHYDKTHVHWTEGFIQAGDEISAFDTRFGRIGCLICFDMAFSEAARVVGVKGADILCAISAVPKEFDWRYVHRRLAGAAINNQYYVLGAQLGYTPKAPMGGHSAAFAPDGAIIEHLDDTRSGTISVDICHDAIRAWRQQENMQPHRRPSLYAPLCAPLGAASNQHHS